MTDDIIVALDENLSTGLTLLDGDVHKALDYALTLMKPMLIEYTITLKEEINK